MLVNLDLLFKVQIVNCGDDSGGSDAQKRQHGKDQIEQRGFVFLIVVGKDP